MVEGDPPPIFLPPLVVRDAPLIPINFDPDRAVAGVKQAADWAPSAAGLKQTGALAGLAGTAAGVKHAGALAGLPGTAAGVKHAGALAGLAGTAPGVKQAAAVSSQANRSYAEIARGNSHTVPPGQAVVPCSKFTDPTPFQSSSTNGANGASSIIVTRTEQNRLVNNLKWVLIGKFSHGRPSLRAIQQFFKNIELQGDLNCANLDAKHIIIECSCYIDFYFIWLQLIWNIHGYDMRMFKWLPNFSTKVESSIAPTWIRIEGLALYLFDETTLLRIASIIGTPIKVDTRNVERSNLGSARVCVELDVGKPIINTISIDIVDEQTGETIETLLASVFYDVLPKFCKGCSHIGHQEEYCKRKLASSSHVHTSQESGKHSNLVMVVPSQNRLKKVWTVVPPKLVASLDKGKGIAAGCTSSVPSITQDGTSTLQGQMHKSTQQTSSSASAQVDAKTAPQQVVQSVAECGSAARSGVGTPQQVMQSVAGGTQPVASQTMAACSSPTALAAPAQDVRHTADCQGQIDQRRLTGRIATTALDQNEVSSKHLDGVLLQQHERLGDTKALPRVDMVRPKSADSALGKKKLAVREISCNSIEQKRTNTIAKLSWADEVEATEEQESKARIAVEHSVVDGQVYEEGIYKNYLVLSIPGYQEMSTFEQKETVACTMADFYQYAISTYIEEAVHEEEVRQEMLIRDNPAPEPGWQVVTHKKKRNSIGKDTSQEQDLGPKASSPPEFNKERQLSKERPLSLDPDYNMERLQVRIRKMKRDSPQKRQLQAELKLLRGA